MIKPSDIFLIENRFLYTKRAKYNMHNGQCDGEWMEMLPPLNPVVTITEALTAFEASEEEASAAQSYTVVGSNLYSVFRILPPNGYELSLNGTSYLESLSISPIDGTISVTVYIRLKAGEVGNYDGNVLHKTTGFSELIAVTGVVFPAITQIKYGFLYNWWATQEQGTGVWLVGDDMRSEGWGVASDSDFTTLATYLGGTSVAGGKLKEMGFTYWLTPNTGATNEVGFNGRGAGFRQYDTGLFLDIKYNQIIFTKTSFNADNAYRLYLSSSNTVYDLGEYGRKTNGASIRLVRPATTAEQLLPDGEIDATYTGNDGKVYRCTKIDTQVWLADNLAETKWSDGNWIQGYDGGTYTPITDANWAALTTAALCAYDDDESNVLI